MLEDIDYPESITRRIMDNDKMSLKPGMSAKVGIPVQIYSNAILIPRSAVIERSLRDTGTVLVVEAGVSKRRLVELALFKENAVKTTRGLTEGEFVVTAGRHSLQDGEKVTVAKP